MTSDQQNTNLNEDLNKSFTHTRPAPDTKPPTERATSQPVSIQQTDQVPSVVTHIQLNTETE